jgi:serine/threonine-protein kinase
VSATKAAEPLRVVVADDAALVREGLRLLLAEAGFEVVGSAQDARELLALVEVVHPDVVLTDVRMPPGHASEGLEAARRIRRSWPGTPVVVLSQHVDTTHLAELLEEDPRGFGYLLKERVADTSQLTQAIERAACGEPVIDPEVVARLVSRSRRDSPLDRLNDREREVLALIAEGRSNQAIADRLFMAPKTVEAHVGAIFTKLGLLNSGDDHRRVLAVLAFLRA